MQIISRQKQSLNQQVSKPLEIYVRVFFFSSALFPYIKNQLLLSLDPKAIQYSIWFPPRDFYR